MNDKLFTDNYDHPIFEFIPLNKYHKMFVEKWNLILYQI